MDVKEFKLRALHGLIRPRYFYIPVKTEEEETISSIIIVIEDEEGNPAYVTGCSISINSYTWPYDGSWNESHTQYTTLYTDSSDTYIFDDDFRWIIPVTDKDNYRVPTPDFSLTGKAPTIDGGGVDTSSIYSYRASFTFTSPKNRIKIDNLRPGRYNLDVTLAPGWYTKTYAPEHWDDIYTNGEPWMPINYQNDYFTLQITKSGQLTGVGEWYHAPEIRPPYTDYIDFFKIKKPFENNVYPIVTKRKTHLRFVLTHIIIPGLNDRTLRTKHVSRVIDQFPYNSGTWSLSAYYGVNIGYFTYNVTKILGFKVYEDDKYVGIYCPQPITVYGSTNQISENANVIVSQSQENGLTNYHYQYQGDTSEWAGSYLYFIEMNNPIYNVSRVKDYSESVHYDLTSDVYDEYAFGPYNEDVHDICIYPDDVLLPSGGGRHHPDNWRYDLYRYMDDKDVGRSSKVVFSSTGDEYVTNITNVTRTRGRGARIDYDRTTYISCTYNNVSFTNRKEYPIHYGPSGKPTEYAISYDISCGGGGSIRYPEYITTGNYIYLGSMPTYRYYEWPGHMPSYSELLELKPDLKPDHANKGYVTFYYYEGMTNSQLQNYMDRLVNELDDFITVESDVED